MEAKSLDLSLRLKLAKLSADRVFTDSEFYTVGAAMVKARDVTEVCSDQCSKTHTTHNRSSLAINCTGTDNHKQRNKTPHTQMTDIKKWPSEQTDYSLFGNTLKTSIQETDQAYYPFIHPEPAWHIGTCTSGQTILPAQKQL